MAPTRIASLLAAPLVLAALASSAPAQTFAPEVTAMVGASGANCVVTGDINGDTGVDFVVTENSSGRITWVPRTLAGFGTPKTIASGLNSPWHSAAGDLDGDGDVDVVTTVYNAGQVFWYENVNWGSQWVAHDLGALASSPGALNLVDLNGDALPEVVVASYGSDEVLGFTNLGGGSFGPRTALVSSIDGPWALGHGDMDGDGDNDLLIGSWTVGELHLALNQGGVIDKPKVFASGLGGPSSLRTGDIDGDGDLDVVSAARNNDEVSWYENIGSPTNMPKHLLGLHNVPFQAETADMDDDGDLDIFVGVSSDSDVILYRGLGGGLFEPAIVVDTQASGCRYVHLADMDGDDDPDLLSANFSGSDVTYYENLSPTKKPKLFEAGGLHCVEAGSVTVFGKNLLGTTATVDGQPVPVANVTEARLDLVLAPDIPGGLHEVALTNGFGTTLWPDALRRFPVVELPATAELGQPVEMVIDNGEPGAFVLAYSGSVWPSPAPFHGFGWYHGLELNGVWMLTSGAFTAAEPKKTLSFPGVTIPALVGVPIHLQAWTAQTDSGHEGFSQTVTIVFE